MCEMCVRIVQTHKEYSRRSSHNVRKMDMSSREALQDEHILFLSPYLATPDWPPLTESVLSGAAALCPKMGSKSKPFYVGFIRPGVSLRAFPTPKYAVVAGGLRKHTQKTHLF